MTFTGPIFVGGPSITLTGTAKEVYEQILVKNPNYNAWDWPEYQTNMAGSGLKKDDLPTTVTTAPGISRRALSPLDIVTCFPPGEKVINWPTQCGEGIQYLQKLNGYCGAPAGLGIGLGVGGCARASCSQNCGIFLCNNNAFAISVWCANIAGDVQNIGAECESPSSAAGNEVGPSLKGQIYRNGWPAWNTAVRNEVC
ncbi:hypothetical protein B0H63DRAFT_235360 [Podospora didyma]|uniref:Uncharacterized protein n=1 Tax=Podospora didyma TaxID=330526 RepID=A0AAE0KJR5_9PEZI|nr:hypothetical protein B0H63DRAFT_235360 [Podospora didyma]